jgi:tRNA pseudouridine38-40 synthase
VRAFRLTVAYDGTSFHGWQAQPGLRTVQGVLEETLSEVAGEGLSKLTGAGRTDAGVHARGQVVSFSAETRLPARALPPTLNRRLPADVRVREAAEVAPEFNARFEALGRRYGYLLIARDDVLLERFAWHPPRRPDPEHLSRATRALEGTHDCSAFRASGGAESRPVCRITRASWTRWEAGWRLDIVADHFLYHMVRNVVGTALAAAATADPAAAMKRVMESRDRRQAGRTAPACGLCLEEVYYPTGGIA